MPLLYKDLTVNSVDEAPMLGGLFDAVEIIIACCSTADDMTLADGFRSQIDIETKMTGAVGFNFVTLDV